MITNLVDWFSSKNTPEEPESTSQKTSENPQNKTHPNENNACLHEKQNIHPCDDHPIWALTDSYLDGEPYLVMSDAAFIKHKHK